jgi:hypothetical protein
MAAAAARGALLGRDGPGHGQLLRQRLRHSPSRRGGQMDHGWKTRGDNEGWDGTEEGLCARTAGLVARCGWALPWWAKM